MANAIQKFAANTACCLATNIKKTDDKLKYGSEDMICCVNKDFIANVMLNLLMCNQISSDVQWYKLRFTGKFTLTGASFPITVTTVPAVTITNNNGDITTDLLVLLTTVFTASSDLNFNTQLFTAFTNGQVIDSSLMFDPISINSSTGEMVIDIYFTSAWGTDTALPTFNAVTIVTSPANTNDFTSVTTKSDILSDSCMTLSQLCDIKDHLTTYCKTC
jgi:hypothetical protein